MGAWSSFIEALRRRRGTPEERLAEVGLTKGMRIADIGAGYGYFALPASEMVGGEGMVYAVEPNPRRALEISMRAEESGAKNVRVLQTGAEELAEVPDGSVDVAISMSSFHHFADADKALLELGRIVRPGGTIYIRDIKAGIILRHGSHTGDFQRTVSRKFPQAEFEDGSNYLVARIKV